MAGKKNPIQDPGDLQPTADEGPVRRNSLANRIYSDLRLALMSGVYAPGDRLNISRLGETYETSATPVREAIIQLVGDRALELKLGHQPLVPILSISRYLEIRETRVPLERLAAELAAARMSVKEIDRLESVQKAFMQAEAEEDWKSALAANQAFHLGIYRCSENETLVRFIENLWLLAGPFISNQYPFAKRPEFPIHPHDLILDALRRRSPSEAGELVVRDLRDGSYRLLEKLRLEAATTGRKRDRKKSKS
ncbi:GntR family transcriptional regulator [Dongia sedimenti]|uniref:GntR family transcriptional regulator n=1 Tax=Dongia sedimenti TaxID=3064282 RepID=A0ABU0YRE1_9PROT|nr:GntR family transcriptional regulator [Rhodospirillaceae bacterium R-7]